MEPSPALPQSPGAPPPAELRTRAAADVATTAAMAHLAIRHGIVSDAGD